MHCPLDVVCVIIIRDKHLAFFNTKEYKHNYPLEN